MTSDSGQIDPTLREIGQIVGLLDAQDQFQVAWLQDPIASIKKNYNNATVNQLTQILESMLGGSSGSSLGVPVQVGARTWFPIQLPPTQGETNPKPLGLYFVTEHVTSVGQPTTDPDNPTVFGVGVMPTYDEAGIHIAPYVYAPILVTPTLSGVGIALETLPIELGVSLTRSDGKPFGQGQVTFTGLALAMQIFVNGQVPTFQAALTQLTLPGSAAPTDYDLLQIGNDTEQWIRISVGLLCAQLTAAAQSSGTQTSDVQAAIGAVTEQLLSLLGLTGAVPTLDWSQLQSQSLTDVVLDWLAEVVGSPSAMQQWLYELYYLFQGQIPDGKTPVSSVVGGSGTSTDPWFVPMLTIAGIGSINFTAAVVTSTGAGGAKTLIFYPGIAIASEQLTPLSAFPSAAVLVQGSFTLLEMTLAAPNGKTIRSVTAPSEILFPTFEFNAIARNTAPGKPLISAPDPTTQNQALFQVGTVQLGIEYDQSGSAIKPVLQLTGVVTEQASWDTIDLLNASDAIKVGEQILSELLTQAIQKFLNVAQGGNAGRATAVAALLGVVPPPAYAGNWPIASQDMLLGANALQLLISDPLRALAAYQSRCLTTTFGTISSDAWKAILPEIGAILTGTAASVGDVQGDGTQASPWSLPLVSLAGGEAVTSLNAYQIQAQDKSVQLQVSLKSGVTLQLTGFSIDAGLVVDLLSFFLPLPDGSQALAASALSRAAIEISITPPNTPPSLGGIALTADQALVSLGWSRTDGFYAGAEIDNLQLISTFAGKPSVTTPIGTIGYNSAQTAPAIDWNKLSQAVMNVLGTWTFEHGGPFGILAATSLGLLPNLPSLFDGKANPDLPYPSQLQLPANWPVFTVDDPTTFFQNPWPDLQSQIGALFSSGDFAEPLMRLVGWSFLGTLPDAPAVLPAGTIDDPWRVTLTALGGIEPLVWREPGSGGNPQRVGFGVCREFAQSGPAGMQLSGSLRLDLAYLELDGKPVPATLPRLTLSATLSNPQTGYLVNDPTTGIQIATAVLGVSASLGSGGLALTPVLTLTQAKLSSSVNLGTVQLAPGPGATYQITVDGQQWTPTQALTAGNTLLNQMMQTLSAALQKQFPQLQAAIDLLVALQIVQPVQDRSPTPAGLEAFGFNPQAWQSLLANPEAFLQKQFDAIVADPAKIGPMLQQVSALFGLDQIQIPLFKDHPNLAQAVATLLQAFGIFEPAGDGNLLSFPNLLAFSQDPAGYLKGRGQSLLSDTKLQQALITEFEAIPGLGPLAQSLPLVFSIDSGNTIRIATSTDPKYALLLAGVVQLLIDIELNLHTSNLSIACGVGIPGIGASVMFDNEIKFDGSQVESTYALQLGGLPSDLPDAFADALQLYSSAGTGVDVATLLERVPLFVLSTAATSAINNYLLPSYPVAQRLLSAVQLATKSDQTYVVQSVLPALLHPFDWVLSEQVLGDTSGGVDFDKVGQLLFSILGGDTYTGPGGVTLSGVAAGKTQPPGLAIGNLPYGLTVTLTADAAVGVEIAVAASPTIQGLDFKLVEGGLSYSPVAGLQCHGYVDLAVTLDGGNVFEIIADYREKPVKLSVVVTPSGGTAITIALVPFTGFQQFLSGASTVLLEFVGEKLIALYNQYQLTAIESEVAGTLTLKTIVTDLVAVGKDVGITDLTTFTSVVQAMVANPVAWLGTNFGAQTAKDFAALLSDLQLPGVTSSAATVVFTLNADISLSFGVATQGGVQTLGLWVDPSITVAFLQAGLQAGVAMDASGKSGTPEFTFAIDLQADLGTSGPFANGPQLQMSFDSKNSSPFALALFPVGQTQPANADLFALDLVPDVAFQINGASVAVATWIEKFAVQILTPYTVDALLAMAPIASYLDEPLVSGKTVTAGSVLAAAGLLDKGAASGAAVVTYKLGNVYADYGALIATPLDLISKLGVGLVEGFLGAVGDQPVTFDFPFSVDGATGQVGIVGIPSGTDVCYGVQLELQDLVIVSGAARDSTPASTEIVLQIGKSTSADVNNKTSWIHAADPNIPADLPGGLTVYFVKAPQGKPAEASLYLMAQLVNFGFDIKGAAESPLINVGGVSLQEIELRTYFSITVEPVNGSMTLSGLDFGAGAELHNIGIPLGPGFKQDLDQQNPVAASLLSAASTKEKDGGSDTMAVNPAFSAGFGYVYSGTFSLQLYDAGEQPTDMLVLPIQRAFGPIQCRELGIGWLEKNYDLSFLFDGSVSLVGLTVDLQELTVGAALTQPASNFFEKLHFSLKGIDVSFEGGPVTIDGGLLETTLGDGTIEYDGNILIRAGVYSFAALGSFASIKINNESNPSLMVFLALAAPIGGPPYFFVTGLAGGFGYNRGFNPPAQDQVATFPFVAGVTDPSIFGAPDAEGNYPISNVLSLLNPAPPALPAAPPELHEYFISAGIMFTSFELVSSYALLTVAFGKDFEIVLLGLSTIQMPKTGDTEEEEGEAFVYAQLGIRVVLAPSEGIFQASAYLSANSFVLDKDCRLTGGFAFYLWFQGSEHPGDFVLTLGGYHPCFQPPNYYPVEPRLGFDWPVTSDLHITGQGYFALTPSAVMAGGLLDITFNAGPLSAWFDASVDMLITWKPFTYDLHISVDIGASLKTAIGTFKISLGADVHIWGPEFRLEADITWVIFSFSISIGDTSRPPVRPAVDWEQFKSYFLPKTKDSDPLSLQGPGALLPLQDPNAAYKNTVLPVVAAGLIRLIEIDKVKTPSVSPTKLVFDVQTHIPVTSVTINGQPVPPPKGLNANVGVAPMNSGTITCNLDASLFAGSDYVTNIDVAVLGTPLGAAAASMWNPNNDLNINSKPIGDTLLGLGNLTLSMTQPIWATPAISIVEYLEFEVLQPHLSLPLSPQYLSPLSPGPQPTNMLALIESTVMAPAVVSFRESVVSYFGDARFVVRSPSALHPKADIARVVLEPQGELNNMAAYAEVTFRGMPLLGQANGVPGVAPVLPTTRIAVSRKTLAAGKAKVATPAPPKLNHMVRSYQSEFGQRWGYTCASDGDRIELAALAGVGSVTKDGMQLRVRPGTSLVIAAEDAHELLAGGLLPIRVTCFDQHDSLLSDRYLPAGKPQRIRLPRRVAHVVVSGLSANAAARQQPILAGWCVRSLLTQVSRGSMLGDAVILRPSVRQTVRNGQRDDPVGTREARDVIAGNDSWLTTVFQPRSRRVQIDLDSTGNLSGESIDTGLEVAVGWLLAGNTSEFTTLKRVDTKLHGSNASVQFMLPEAPSRSALALLSVRCGKGLRQVGAYLIRSAKGVDNAAVHQWLQSSTLHARVGQDDIESSIALKCRKAGS